MVQALISLDENTNRVLNMVKATYELKDKGEAIAFIVDKYIEEENEPKLRADFIKKMRKIEKQKPIRIGTIEKLRQRYEK